MSTEAQTTAPTDAALQRPRFSLRFSARDLLRVAIFAVIFIVATYVIGMLGILSPLVWLVIVLFQAIVGGVTVILFLTRVKHAGMLTLFGIVVALFYLLSGNTLLSTAGIIVLALIAELILWAGRYRSKWATIWAYTVFGLSFFTPFLPLLTDRQAYFASSSWTQMGDDYVRASDTLLSTPVIGSLAGGTLVASFLGGLLGSAILRKHFVRAGLA
ncbi:MptD family putative ECF transporter S component [Microbacterium horticulturae]|uniref:MptD family putative ECF transporter S component n=1 Tax=Microbacterium horticulturae TaxID=3028316 RepID=A0ABY8BWU5_9MICO|nr:MptD family putative ECF transporter S component [Microbacterium sp. KACC 23027]WEG08664.1 MptD family putative ECF transporter S component [Microbacterium sp. KACC 23027]